jgi:branched-subunit amino acid aminotransferase/4-amino-4-deoxychorismate lyase
VIRLARDNDVPCEVRRVSLSEVLSADEMFTTGTMGELSPVLEVDGRTLGDGGIGPMTRRMRELYAELTASKGQSLPF